ncbi:hypothetical protein B0J13DRAFT_182075 [Dactylonectria estremocensis]|uniref:Uncharacterized protein n=1 Tax=Dactylonectria estremocensis TaxID=1079267 RepID=A0A9P9FC43_9HYPO|nr:hypothetical protein B0J13DRAFT_182075 [Dactylonectria estremocensis]
MPSLPLLRVTLACHRQPEAPWQQPSSLFLLEPAYTCLQADYPSQTIIQPRRKAAMMHRSRTGLPRALANPVLAERRGSIIPKGLDPVSPLTAIAGPLISAIARVRKHSGYRWDGGMALAWPSGGRENASLHARFARLYADTFLLHEVGEAKGYPIQSIQCSSSLRPACIALRGRLRPNKRRPALESPWSTCWLRWPIIVASCLGTFPVLFATHGTTTTPRFLTLCWARL